MSALTLHDCCTMQTGIPVGRKHFAESGTIGVVQLKDVNAEGQLLSPLEQVKFERPIKKDKFLQNDDVLLKGRGTHIIAAHIENAPDNIIASSAYFILRAKPNILPGFLAWYLNNNRLPITQSTVIPLLQLSNLKEMPVHLPERDVQQQIIDTHKLIEKAHMLSDQYYKKISQLLKGAALNAALNRKESL